MKFIVLLLVFFACAFVIGSYITKRFLRTCPKAIVNHVPYIRTFTEEQEQPSYVMAMYKKMFWGNSPWVQTQVHQAQLKVGKKQPYAWGERPKNILVGKSTNRDDYLNTFFG